MQYKEEECQSVKEALAEMLTDPHFKSSPQMSAFIGYIVEQTLSGNADRIKAYTIAVDALGKPDDFDPQSNPSVRVLAKRLRDNLDQYYQEEGRHASIRIAIKPGSYVPTFEKQEPTQVLKDDKLQTTSEKTKASDQPTYIEAITTTRSWFEARHRRLTAGGVLLMALIAWQLPDHMPSTGINDYSVADVERETPTEPLVSVDIASLEHIDQSGDRPPIPRLTLINNDSRDKDLTNIGRSVSDLLKEYDNVIVIEEAADSLRAKEKWPEDYELHYRIEEKDVVSLAVKHAQSGRILHRHSLPFSRNQERLSQDQAILDFSQMLLSHKGPILKDYRQNDKLTPTMRCAFLFDAYYADKTRSNRRSAQRCATELKNAGLLPKVPEIL